MAAEEPEEVTQKEISLRVKTINDQNYQIRVAPNLLVSDLKEKIEVVSEIAEDRQRLIYRGQVLKDDQTLASSRVEDGTTLHLVSRPLNPPALISSPGPEQPTQPAAQPQAPSILESLFGQPTPATGTAANTEVGGDDGASMAARLMLMSALSGGGGTVPLRLGGDSLPSTLFSNPTSPARDGPHVPEPGSLEHVRQGLLTMHTILAANPLLDHREATAAADVVNAATQAAAARLVSERDALARAATEAEATAEAATVVVEAAAAAATSATSAEASPETLPSLADGGSSSGDSALSEEGANASPEDADNEFFDPQTSFEENGYHDVSISTDAASAPTTAVTAASPRRRHERAGVPLFFVGQWVDCKDTVNQWLESTIMEIDTRIPSDTSRAASRGGGSGGGGRRGGEGLGGGGLGGGGGGGGSWGTSGCGGAATQRPAADAQRRRLATLRAAQRATRQLRRANARLAAATEALGAASSAAAATAASHASGGGGGGGREAEERSAARSAATTSILSALEMLGVDGQEGGGSGADDSSAEDEDDEEAEEEEEKEEKAVPCLLVHYNGWPVRWDEWLPFDSPRLAPFRTRTTHAIGTAQAHTFVSPSPLAAVAAAVETGENDVRVLLPDVTSMLGQEFSPLLSGLQRLCEDQLELEQWQQAAQEAEEARRRQEQREQMGEVDSDDEDGIPDLDDIDSDDDDRLPDLEDMSEDGESDDGEEVRGNQEDVGVSSNAAASGLSSTSSSSPSVASLELSSQQPTPNPSQTLPVPAAPSLPPLSPPAALRAASVSSPPASAVGTTSPSSALPWTSSPLLEGGRLRRIDHTSVTTSPLSFQATPPGGGNGASEESQHEEKSDELQAEASGYLGPQHPPLPSTLSYSRIEGLQSSEVARRERIREVASGLAPLADRLGRLLADLAPHLAALSNGDNEAQRPQPQQQDIRRPPLASARVGGDQVNAASPNSTMSRLGGGAAHVSPAAVGDGGGDVERRDAVGEDQEAGVIAAEAAATVAALSRDRAGQLRQRQTEQQQQQQQQQRAEPSPQSETVTPDVTASFPSAVLQSPSSPLSPSSFSPVTPPPRGAAGAALLRTASAASSPFSSSTTSSSLVSSTTPTNTYATSPHVQRARAARLAAESQRAAATAASAAVGIGEAVGGGRGLGGALPASAIGALLHRPRTGRNRSSLDDRSPSPSRSYRQLISSAPSPSSGPGGGGNIDIHIHAIVAPLRTSPTPPSPAPGVTPATPPPLAPTTASPPNSSLLDRVELAQRSLAETLDSHVVDPQTSQDPTLETRAALASTPTLSAPSPTEGGVVSVVDTAEIQSNGHGAASAESPAAAQTEGESQPAVQDTQVDVHGLSQASSPPATPSAPPSSISASIGSLTSMFRRMSALSRSSSGGNSSSSSNNNNNNNNNDGPRDSEDGGSGGGV